MSIQNVDGRFIDVNGAQLYANVREGDGPTLIFLHYWGGTHRTWAPVLERLEPKQAFVAYDQRGWGKSANAPGPYSLTQHADDARAIIDTVARGPFVIVGHSAGGKVAQLLAARKPAGLAGVVLVAPAPAAPVGVTEELRGAVTHAYDNEAAVRQGIDMMLTNGELSAELRQQIVEDSLSAGDDARLTWPRESIVEDVSAGLDDVKVPVLVLGGSHDKIDPPTVLAEHLLPLIPTAKLTVLEGTGHLSPLEVPDQVAASISGFIAQTR